MAEPFDFTEFLSPAYRLDTVNSACSRMINMYLELIEKGPRAGKLRARSIPGPRVFANLGGDPMRALLEVDGGNRLFAVMGGGVFEVFADGTGVAQDGFVNVNAHPVTIVGNGIQLALASGGLGYIVNGGTPAGVVTPITFTDGSPLRAATMTFLKDRFIANVVDSKEVFVSNLAPDGAIWDAADVKIKEGYPDNVARVYADNEQLWVFGNDVSTEVWAPSTDVFPFQQIDGAVLKYPTTAPYSVAGVLGHRAWLNGAVVYAAYGLDPQRISDYGVEEAIQSYGDTSNAEAFAYVSGGHIFYAISFPNVNRTWVYDASIKAWHERGLWDRGQYRQYCGRVYARAFGKDLVGDPQTGIIWELDPRSYTDTNGFPLRRQITAPYLTSQMRNIRYSQFTLDCDTGVGLDVAPGQPGYDPQVIMRYSDDRGKTYGNDRQESLGRVGQVKERVIFNQLGASRIGKAFDTVVSDPVPWTVNGAYLRTGGPEVGR